MSNVAAQDKHGFLPHLHNMSDARECHVLATELVAQHRFDHAPRDLLLHRFLQCVAAGHRVNKRESTCDEQSAYTRPAFRP